MTISLDEAKKVIDQRFKYCDKLVEQWDKTDVGNVYEFKMRDQSLSKQRLIASALTMQESYMKNKLNETLISSQFGTTPENVLKVITLGVGHSARGDMFYEYPLQSMNDAFYWVHKEREQALRGSTAGDNIFTTINRNYPGERAEKETVGSGATQHDIDTGYGTIVPNKVMIMLDGELVGYDDGEGGITRVGTALTTGVYNEAIYATGHVKVEFSSVVNSPAVITVLAHWDSEDKTLFDANLGTVGLSVEMKRFNPRQMPIGYSFTDLTALQLGTTGLGDVHERLVRAASEEHSMARDYRAIQQARGIALGNTAYTYNADFAAVGEVQSKSHAQNILSTIDDISGDIQDDIKRGEVNVAIAGSKAITYLKKHELWERDTTWEHQGIYKAGTLDNISVFFCPQLDGVIETNEVILSFKNPAEEIDVPIVFGNLTELKAELRTPDLRTEGTLATVEDSIQIERKYLRMLTIENL